MNYIVLRDGKAIGFAQQESANLWTAYLTLRDARHHLGNPNMSAATLAGLQQVVKNTYNAQMGSVN